ncbi:helix-turn-helix transcriptional regulator [Kutzneria kofuensis]|uniref:DNA-binding NarL/FixJ family response regulator/energy-coupling factor transporter ATP-binding protein EcfA2 n=1 Tax=Kutzneria kofuensis TaxID=103725 RepID=A0A7W9KE60_9PSEU|nr:LuxR family transcriptional regulator [Kutzneria kofuensis]MBB5890553.1 DNA-binding NarL/FixJ family response regulator/energy-coupling factor transporter ATP-binding protein EcfA2 [Kutzneria kofuensis]
MNEPGPVGRGELLRSARELLAGGSVLFCGPAGIGKSTLLGALAGEPAPGGGTVLRCAPAESDRRLPFVCLIDLLADVSDDVLATLPAPLRAALDAALLRGEHPTSDQSRLGVRLAVLQVLQLLSDCAPVTLVIDDLQWVDRPSAEVLAFVARRLTGDRLHVLAAERVPDGEQPLHRHLCPPNIAELPVPPLTPRDVARLLLRDNGVLLPHGSVLQIHQLADGNPFYALELGRAVLRSGVPESPGRPLPVPRRLRALLLDRLGELSDRAQATLLLASAATRPSLTLLRAAGHPDAAADLVAAERCDLAVADDDGIVRFRHPLIRAAIYAEAASHRRIDAHARLADVVAEPVERARHLALAKPHEDESVAATLMAAAASARRRGAPVTAAELAAMAADRTPWDSQQLRSERRLVAAEHACDAGLRAEARTAAESVLADARCPRLRVRARLVLLRNAGQALHDLGPLIDDGLADAAGDPGLEAPLRMWLAGRALLGGDTDEAAEQAARSAELATLAGDASTAVRALTRLAHLQSLRGDPSAAETVAQAIEIVERNPHAESWELERHQAVTELHDGDLQRAEQRLLSLLRKVEETAAVEDTVAIMVTLAEVQSRAGQCRRAVDTARRAMSLFSEAGVSCPPALYAAALAEANGGSVEAAVEYAERGARESEADGDQLYLMRNLAVLGQVQLTTGDAAAAVETLCRVSEIGRRMDIRDPAVVRWYADLAEALVATGSLEDARELIDQTSKQALDFGRHTVSANLERAAALLAVASGLPNDGVARLRAVADGQAGLDRARTLIALAGVERRCRRRAASRAALSEAYDICVAVAATPWAERVREDLDRTGASARADHAVALTVAEQRVAELVRAGSTNREVAAVLFISVKTVEATLSRIYRKVGVRSRTELVRAMDVPVPQAREPEPEPLRSQAV